MTISETSVNRAVVVAGDKIKTLLDSEDSSHVQVVTLADRDGNLVSDNTLELILKELRILNTHMSEITGLCDRSDEL